MVEVSRPMSVPGRGGRGRGAKGARQLLAVADDEDEAAKVRPGRTLNSDRRHC